MKPIDDNQRRIMAYMVANRIATRDDLMPLIDYYENQNDAYLSAIAKLMSMNLIDSKTFGTYEITSYGMFNFKTNKT